MEILFKHIDPKVQNILTGDFYWNPDEHTLPFGDVNAHNFLYDFQEDSEVGNANDPVEYIKRYFELDTELYELDPVNIEKLNQDNDDQYSPSYEDYLELCANLIEYSDFSEETEALLDLELPKPFNSLYSSLDSCIIGLAFLTACKHGTIPIELGILADIALTRESLDVMLQKTPIKSREKRALEIAILKTDLKRIMSQ